MSYCEYCQKLPPDNIHRFYHDTKYGVKISDDHELFGRFILEINQAGLSWDTILKREEQFRLAYDNYDIEKIAQYSTSTIDRLMKNEGIIRNRRKIEAVVYNANQVIAFKKENGSFFNWIQSHQTKNTEEWVKLFKKNFKFVGTEIVKEFLFSSGIVEGAHDEACPIFTHKKLTI
jgi:DNA-3-methyladenine glycosylase I